MRGAILMIAALGTALSTRRDLRLEILALRHQLAVLGHSDRRFRPADRLLWLCLRRCWPGWKEALVLVQPATVARWQREGLRRCWQRRPGPRPGRRGSIRKFEPSSDRWPPRTVSGALRAYTASYWSSDSSSRNARCRGKTRRAASRCVGRH